MVKLADIPKLEHNLKGCFDAQYLVMFPNGYGASIITGECAHTDNEHPYELAEIKLTHDDIKLLEPITGERCFDVRCSITYEHYQDVIGYLTEDEVNKYLEEIQSR